MFKLAAIVFAIIAVAYLVWAVSVWISAARSLRDWLRPS